MGQQAIDPRTNLDALRGGGGDRGLGDIEAQVEEQGESEEGERHHKEEGQEPVLLPEGEVRGRTRASKRRFRGRRRGGDGILPSREALWPGWSHGALRPALQSEGPEARME